MVKIDKVAQRALQILADARRAPADGGPQSSGLLQNTALLNLMYGAATSPDRGAFSDLVHRALKAGVSVDDMTSVLIPEVAQKLGRDWVEDQAGFGAVTVGCVRLQSAMRLLEGFRTKNSVARLAPKLNSMVTVPVGAQHTLGAAVLSTQLRQAGSHVHLAVGASAAEIADRAHEDRYDAVMISAALGQDMAALNALIKELRKAAPGSKVILGGSVLGEHADAARLAGADFATNNWIEALNVVSQGLSRKQEAL